MVANGFDGVPLAITGAKHSANLFRMLAYSALGGQEGIITPGDLKVTPTPGTADGFVHMASGSAGILNRSAGAFSEEYIARAPLVSDIPIASTGSTGRSDLIVARVEDQEYPPWSSSKYTDPAQIENGPYIFPRVISGVANTTTRADQLGGAYVNHSMIAVARIDIPPMTTNITSDMIKDLRQLARPHTSSDLYLTRGPMGGENLPAGAVYSNWPSTSRTVAVPKWATHAVIGITLDISMAGAIIYLLRAKIGSLTGASSVVDYDGGTAGAESVQPSVFADLDVRSLAGTNAVVRVEARRADNDPGGGVAQVSQNSAVNFDIRFYERTV